MTSTLATPWSWLRVYGLGVFYNAAYLPKAHVDTNEQRRIYKLCLNI